MVATVVAIRDASSTVPYFARDGYCSQSACRRTSRWCGALAAAPAIAKTVDPDTFSRALRGYVPGTDIRLGRIRDGKLQRRLGLDITLSCPKSVSIEALVYRKRDVIEAFEEAVSETIAYLERTLLYTREYDPAIGRTRTVRGDGALVAVFRHVTSRNSDPQLHAHCVLVNVTRGPTGDWRSLALARVAGHRHVLGAVFRSALARGLRERGYALRPRKIGHLWGFEIAGYDRPILEAFSSRRLELLAAIKEAGRDYSPATAQWAALVTRRRKDMVALREVQAYWSQLRRERGLSRDFALSRAQETEEAEAPSALEVVVLAAAALEEWTPAFAERQLLALALSYPPAAQSPDDVADAIAQLVSEGELRETDRPGVGRAYLTARTAGARNEVVRLPSEESLAPALVDAMHLALELPLGALTENQKDAVRMVLLGRQRTVGLEHRRGAGKAVVLREVVRLCRDRTVVGCAPSASAAATLARDAGIGTWTLRSFLGRCRDVVDGVAHREELEQLQVWLGGAVLVVDVVSHVSTAQARDLARIVDRLGVARLILVADSQHLRSPHAGQPFVALRESGMVTARLGGGSRDGASSPRWAMASVRGGRHATVEELDIDVLEVWPEELAEVAGLVWLALSARDRERALVVAETPGLLAGINATIQDGLVQEGALRGEPLKLRTLVDRRLNNAQKADVNNYRAGDALLFEKRVLNYRLQPDDACVVVAVELGRSPLLRLRHPDGTGRHVRPRSGVRHAFAVCEVVEVSIRVGDRVRWTRPDAGRRLLAGQHATVIAIGANRLTLVTGDGRELVLDHDDRHLRHLALAYSSADAQDAHGGATACVIAVVDSGVDGSDDGAAFPVRRGRAPLDTVVVTDSLAHLEDAVEAHMGRRLTVAREAEGPDAARSEALRERLRALMRRGGSPLAKAVPRQLLDESRKDGKRGGDTRWAPLEEPVREALLPVAACARRLEDSLARRRLLSRTSDRQGMPDDEIAHPGYGRWRLDVEAAVTSAEHARRRQDSPHVAGDEHIALDVAIGRAQQLLARDDDRIVAGVLSARARAWLGEWDAVTQAGVEAGPLDASAPATLVARSEDILRHPGLPAPLAQAMTARLDRRDAELDLHSWQAQLTDMEDGARAAGQALHEHADFESTVAAARELAARPALPGTDRRRVSAWVEGRQLERASAAVAPLQRRLAATAASTVGTWEAQHADLVAARATAATLLDGLGDLSAQRPSTAVVAEADAAIAARAEYTAWWTGVTAHETECEKRSVDAVADPGHAQHRARAQALTTNPAVPAAVREHARAWVAASLAAAAQLVRAASRGVALEQATAAMREATLEDIDGLLPALTRRWKQAEEEPCPPGTFEEQRLVAAGTTAETCVRACREFLEWRETGSSGSAAHVTFARDLARLEALPAAARAYALERAISTTLGAIEVADEEASVPKLHERLQALRGDAERLLVDAPASGSPKWAEGLRRTHRQADVTIRYRPRVARWRRGWELRQAYSRTPWAGAEAARYAAEARLLEDAALPPRELRELQTVAARIEFVSLQSRWESHCETCRQQRVHQFVADGCEQLVALAVTLQARPHLPDTANAFIGELLEEFRLFREVQSRCRDINEEWRAIQMEARELGVSVWEVEGVEEVAADMKALLGFTDQLTDGQRDSLQAVLKDAPELSGPSGQTPPAEPPF